MTNYVSCRKCLPGGTPFYYAADEVDKYLFLSDKLPPGTWIFRGGGRYFCPHLTTAARVTSKPWYSDVSATMNARQGREDIR